MNIKNTIKTKRTCFTILLLLAITTPIFISMISSNFIQSSNPNDFSNDSNEKPISVNQGIGEDTWWNSSFQWRQVINITNPYDLELVDYTTYIRINHTALINAGKIQDDLGDVRIVENGALRNYYFETEYNRGGDYAYIWFETSINASSTEYDTYLYYGNDAATPSSIYYKPERRGTHWWGFDEGSGTTTYDYVGSINGALNNMDPNNDWVDGELGQCLDFDGTDDYVQMNSDPIPNGQFSISLWFNADSTGGTIFDMTDDPIYLYIGLRSNTLEWYYEDSRDRDIQLSYNFPVSPTNQWYHVVAVGGFNDNLHQIWVNGEIKTQNTVSLSNKGTLANPRIATYTDSYASPNSYFDGRVDDIRIFDSQIGSADMNWLFTNYSLETNLLNQQERAAFVKLIVRDIDGRPVPDAEVLLTNDTLALENRTVYQSTTTNDGEAIFSSVHFGEYNVSIEYFLENGTYTYETVLYNSSELSDEVLNFQGLTYNETIDVKIWSIDFEVDDYDGDPMDYGYILVYNDSNSDPLLANLTLDSGTGKATFRWLNRSSYYYEVFYYNRDYVSKHNLIRQNTLNRESKFSNQIKNLNETITDKVGNSYSSQFAIFAEGSSESTVGKNRMITSNISLTNINEYLLNLQVDYLGSDNSWIPFFNKEYENFETQDFVNLNIFDSFEAYGLRFTIDFYNGSGGSLNNGICSINYTETTHELITANMSKLKIYTFDNSEESQPIENLIVEVENATSGDSIVNLITDQQGEAKSQTNDLPFWYFHDDYNFTLSFYGTPKSYRVTLSDEPYNPDKFYQEPGYNYLLNDTATLEFNVTLNIENFKSRFQNVSGTADAVWGASMQFSVNYTTSEDGGDTWQAIQDPDYVEYEIRRSGYTEVIKSGDMIDEGNGNYSIQLNSGELIGGRSYILEISGHKLGFTDPLDHLFYFDILAVSTGFNLYNYTSRQIIATDTISEYYNEVINITLSYYESENPTSTLSGATINYEWDWGSGSFEEDPTYPGFYNLEINTSQAASAAKYGIQVDISLQNHSAINTVVYLDIEKRPTLINGSNYIQRAPNVYVLNVQNFTFEYSDALEDTRLDNLETASYIWFRLDDQGNPLSGSGNEGSGDLVKTQEDLFLLDFNTETRELGSYTIFITLQKRNYEVKNAQLTLTIQKRMINVSNLPNKQVNVVQGDSLTFRITLRDPTNNSQLLNGANVSLNIQGTQYNLEEVQTGVYEYQYSTGGINAFFIPNTLQAELTIEKGEYYQESTYEFSIIVGMTEIFPGFPIFYFLMIVIGVGAVVGSLATYRYIQIARIPEFVKRARAIKKEIKGGKSISEKNLYPSKEEYIAEMYGDEWAELGISLEDKLGIQSQKSSELNKTIEGGAQ